jgi:hypothetical protein
MRVLIINEEIRAEIRASITRARKVPVTVEVLKRLAMPFEGKDELLLADRSPDFSRPPTQQVLIPNGYRASISFEEQPDGLCKHLSVSVDDAPGMFPNEPAVRMIAEEFGLHGMQNEDWGGAKLWIEEWESGCFAINLVQLDIPEKKH